MPNYFHSENEVRVLVSIHFNQCIWRLADYRFGRQPMSNPSEWKSRNFLSQFWDFFFNFGFTCCCHLKVETMHTYTNMYIFDFTWDDCYAEFSINNQHVDVLRRTTKTDFRVTTKTLNWEKKCHSHILISDFQVWKQKNEIIFFFTFLFVYI